MVKFTRDSHCYHIVISKLSSILALQPTGRYNTDHNPRSIDDPELGTGPYGSNNSKYEFTVELDMFKRTIGLTEAEEGEFKATSFDSLQDFIGTLQQEQEQKGSMMYMKRLEPFLVTMKEYVEVVKDADVFVNISDVISYLWVSEPPTSLENSTSMWVYRLL